MKKVRITILKTTFDSELAKEFGMIGLGPCPLMKAGEVYYADYAKPEGFCDEAWKAIYQYVFIRCHTNFRHPFNLSWSGKTCDIRRSSKTTS